MPQHLRDAAERRHQEAFERATVALGRLCAEGKPITFSSVARAASVSTDFLYRQPQVRQRIQELRNSKAAGVAALGEENPAGGSAPVRALSRQIKELRQRHTVEVRELQKALAVAQGENLALRRRLAT